MKYIFLTTKKKFTEQSFELQKCGIALRDSIFFQIKPVPEEWAVEHLTKKAYNDVYLNKATFDDDLTPERLQRLYNLIHIFKYIINENIKDCIIVENILDFCRIFGIINEYLEKHKDTDILFLDNSYQINYSHYKYFGDSFKQNEYVSKKAAAFYINIHFVKKFLESQVIFYKPFEYTLNSFINESKIITFFINKDIYDLNDYYSYKNTIIINSGKILLTLLGLGIIIILYNKRQLSFKVL